MKLFFQHVQTCLKSLKIQQAWSKLLLKFVSDNNQLWQQQSHFLDCKQSVACGQKTNSTLERIKAQCGYDATLRWPSLWWWLSHLSTTQPPVRSFFFKIPWGYSSPLFSDAYAFQTIWNLKSDQKMSVFKKTLTPKWNGSLRDIPSVFTHISCSSLACVAYYYVWK